MAEGDDEIDLGRRSALRGALGLAGAATAAACAASDKPPVASDLARFEHGVASGDPLQDRVVIWTRATPLEPAVDAIALRWMIATDPFMQDMVDEGFVRAEAARDYTVKVDVDGLEPGTVYHYRFIAGDSASPVGRTRTLPEGRTEQVVIAAASCANHPFGYFHAYRDIAERGADLVLHLGDYIYEYGKDEWGWSEGVELDRAPEPPRELITLSDYRIRHAQYRRDPDLQAAHAAAPWIVSWDDHESANNTWTDGAENHAKNGLEGLWIARKRAALQAYFEWMPVREPELGRAREALWRRFDIGDLATLVMLETRLSGRDEQLTYDGDLDYIESVYDLTDPDAPQLISEAEADAKLAEELILPDALIRMRTPFRVADGEALAPITDYAEALALNEGGLPKGYKHRARLDRFLQEKLYDPARRMISSAQERFVVDAIAEGADGASVWQILGNQVIFARQDSPDLDAAWDEATKDRLIEASPWIAPWIARSALRAPNNLDAWDGYPVQRDRLADAFSDAGANLVVLTGDTHVFWANEITTAGGERVGPEFGTTGISSPSWMGVFEPAEPSIADLITAANETVRWVDGGPRGYVRLTLTREEGVAEMIAVTDVRAETYEAEVLKRWRFAPRNGDDPPTAIEEV